MVGKSLAQISTCTAVLSSSSIIVRRGSSNFLPYLPSRQPEQLMRVRVMTADAGHDQAASSSSEKNSPLSVVLKVPQSFWRQTLRPLSDFGFGRRSIWEGGVGLFLVSGAVLLALSLAWLRGFQLRSKFRKYLAVFEFAQACGICKGTPVRIRGVEDDKIIIPRNSLIEVNQSGLLMETLIDIAPKDPIPLPSVGPLDAECVKEGLIVCDRQKIKGYQGVSLDALVGIFTRLGHEMEEIGVAKSYLLAERVAAVIEETKPLLTKACVIIFVPHLSLKINYTHANFGSDVVISQIKEMAKDVHPLLYDVRDSSLLKEFETLTRSLTQASEDLR
ncbi:hypothetical protein GH714_005583 [Hevea brasiliensis]|uniref:Mce/MlaD domain-containing protein n=1 Tax=Hevea brasiliensis TaxID=3981 RepID=A0A6A6N745_HEVBR|nr:hypothetical protein GH714_005583 [Hevea brasiliensis]